MAPLVLGLGSVAELLRTSILRMASVARAIEVRSLRVDIGSRPRTSGKTIAHNSHPNQSEHETSGDKTGRHTPSCKTPSQGAPNRIPQCVIKFSSAFL